MAVLGYLPKLKSGLELAFGADFLAWFFHTNAPYLILYQLTKFQCHIFFFLNVSNKTTYQVLVYTVDDVISFKIYLLSSSKALTEGRKWGEVRKTKI